MQSNQPGAIWPASDFDDAQVREVYSRFGLAMFMAQVLEHGMVNALLVLRLMPTMKDHADRSSWDEAFDRFFDAELAKTFGNMVRALEQTGAFAPDLIARLGTAKVQRDHLAHRFFREHDLNFMTRPGRTKMIAECEVLIELFKGIDREVESLVAPQRERFGITSEWIEEHVRIMENEARRTVVGATNQGAAVQPAVMRSPLFLISFQAEVSFRPKCIRQPIARRMAAFAQASQGNERHRWGGVSRPCSYKPPLTPKALSSPCRPNSPQRRGLAGTSPG
jgi:hypothetical protein